jgi:hypothetical protein
MLTAAASPGAASAVVAGARSDFNGDGYADLVVGEPAGSVGGQAKAGYVNVVWGGPSGLGSRGSVQISQATAGIPGTPEANDGFGTSAESPDLNGDGYSELVTSAPGESLSSTATDRHGMVTVVWGSASGFSGGFTAAKGASAYSRLGRKIAAGDYDHDGDEDLALSASGQAGGSLQLRPGPITAGSATTTSLLRSFPAGGVANDLVTGDFDGNGTDDLAVTWAATADMGTDVLRWDQGQPVTYWQTSDYAVSLAAADLWKDGVDDLMLGGVRAKQGAAKTYCPDNSGGTVRTLYAQSDGIFGTVYDCMTQDSPGVPGASEAGDGFGSAVAAGDMNGDGFPELVVGAGQEAIGSLAKAGMITVITGSGHGPDGGDGAFRSTQNTQGMPGAVEAGDRFGAAVALADYNGDGRADLAAGAPGENSSSGGVWYVPGPQKLYPAGVRVLTPTSQGLPSPTSALAYGAVLGR